MYGKVSGRLEGGVMGASAKGSSRHVSCIVRNQWLRAHAPFVTMGGADGAAVHARASGRRGGAGLPAIDRRRKWLCKCWSMGKEVAADGASKVES